LHCAFGRNRQLLGLSLETGIPQEQRACAFLPTRIGATARTFNEEELDDETLARAAYD